MPERKKREISTSQKRKKRTDVATHAEILPVKDLWEHTFDSMPDLIAILDNNHRIVRANKSMAQRLGVTPEQCVGLKCFKYVHKLDSPPSFCPHALTIADGKEHTAEVHEDNLGGDFLVSTTPLFDQQGKMIGSVHVARDITQRKKDEEEIKSLSRFPAENPSVVMRISKDGNILYSNNAGLTILNEWKCQVGQPVPSKWAQLVEDVFKSGMKKEFEEEHGNQTFLIMLAPIAGEGYVNVYGRDITERKKAEEELRKARDELETRVQERTKELKDATETVKAERKRFFDVLEKLPAYMVLLTPDYHVSYANRFFRERFGEDGGRRCFEYLFNRSEPCEPCETYKTLKKMAPLEWEWTGPDGHNYYIFDSPFTDVDGSTLIMEVGIDITDRKKAEEALHKAVEQLKEENQERIHTEQTLRLEEARLDALLRLSQISEAPLNEITGFTLEQAVALTHSKIGFIGFLNEDETIYTLHTASKDVVKECNVVGSPMEWPVSEIGLWGDAIRERKTLFVNDYSLPYPRKKGLPPGHVPIKRFMVVPFFEGKRIVAIAGVGNKTSDYDMSDERQISLLLSGMWSCVQKNRSREELQKTYNELEIRVDERTKELRKSTWELQAEVTERKKAEENLRETRNYLENLIGYANAPIIVWNPDYRVTRFNHAFERLTGFDAKDVLDKPLEILFPEDSKEESLNHIRRAISGAHWETVEIPILRTDGSVRTVLWNSANILGKDGTTVVATIAQGEDITERKQALESLRESQKDLNRAQAVAMTGSWRLEVPDNVLRWSDETYRMFGIPNGTPVSYETFLSIVHPDDREFVDQQWKEAMKGEPYDIEHRIIVDGKVKWVREKAELEFNKDGLFLGGFGTVQDVTEKREMHAKLEEYSQQLEQLVEQKTQELKEAQRLVTIGETAGMVGHDIRNPLQSIEGAVYLAREELKTLPDGSSEKKELYEILEMIRNQTNYIDHIVADLQDFSRTPMPQLRETNLHELIIEALSTTEIPENIQLQTLIQDDLKTVTVDPVFMKRVFLNLAENAVHAMPKGGKLTIKAFQEDECTIIHVEDTGAGISEEDKPKIFTPLFTTKSKGQGFGLAVCKKLVEAHNGEITFESEVGKGTMFKIRLPQRKETI